MIRREKSGGPGAGLAQTLAELGVAAYVEGRGTMALVTVDAATVERLTASDELRMKLIEAARAAGFATVAIEIAA